jgi:hypothetical protein
MPPKPPSDEDQLFSGPKVARTSIPKSMKTSNTEEDPLSKRIFFFLGARAFTSGAWMAFAALALGIIFTILVTLKGFLCPDIATQQGYIPSYCPQKNVHQSQ